MSRSRYYAETFRSFNSSGVVFGPGASRQAFRRLEHKRARRAAQNAIAAGLADLTDEFLAQMQDEMEADAIWDGYDELYREWRDDVYRRDDMYDRNDMFNSDPMDGRCECAECEEQRRREVELSWRDDYGYDYYDYY